MNKKKQRITPAEVATKFGIPETTVIALKRAMATTWSNIGDDTYDCFGGERAALKAYKGSEAAMVAESTLDADHVTVYGGIFPEWSELRNHTDVLELGEAAWEAY